MRSCFAVQRGNILYRSGSGVVADCFQEANLVACGNCTEGVIGTTAPGIVLVEEKPSVALGRPITQEEFGGLGMKVLKKEKGFNDRAGFSRQDDRLPAFFVREKLSPHDSVFDLEDDAIDSFLNF